MKWYYLDEAVKTVGKSARAVRYHLQKYRDSNPPSKEKATMFRYKTVNIGGIDIEKLQVSHAFLQGCFPAKLHPPARRGEKGGESGNPPPPKVAPPTDYEKKLQDRENKLHEYYQKQIGEIKEAKQQSIDILQNQIHEINGQMNKVLEQYAIAQMTINNLLPNTEQRKLDIDATEIEEIIEEKQKPTGLRPTKEYIADAGADTKKVFSDWLKKGKDQENE